MTNEEKRFKVTKIEKYEKDLSEIKKVELRKGLYLALLACIGVNFLMLGNRYGSDPLSFCCQFFASVSGALSMFTLIDLIENISEKTALSRKIQDLEDEIEFAEQEEIRKETEQRGKSRC